jgi:AraC-like DNA-binding protein
MVKTGHDVETVGFRSSLHSRLPVEVAGRRDVLARIAADRVGAAEQIWFDVFILMQSDRGGHEVDFVEIPARHGRLVRVRAGQVQRWDRRTDPVATVVMGAPGASSLQPWFPGDPCWADLTPDAFGTARALVDGLAHNQHRFDGERTTIRLMVSLFESLAALFDQAATETATDTTPVYLAFRAAMEQDLARHHDVAHYARLLGYCERTLTRACLQSTGQTAKQVLINRLVLEAKRLLSQTDHSVADVSDLVGFTEPTNFTKFFARHTGTTPSRFRHPAAAGNPATRRTAGKHQPSTR